MVVFFPPLLYDGVKSIACDKVILDVVTHARYSWLFSLPMQLTDPHKKDFFCRESLPR